MSLAIDDEATRRGKPVLELDLKGLRFGQSEVLGALNMSVMPGETVAILGP